MGGIAEEVQTSPRKTEAKGMPVKMTAEGRYCRGSSNLPEES
jgi:hypothetical protein